MQNKSSKGADVDISMPGGKQKTHWTVHVVIWVSVLSAFTAMFFFEAPFEYILGGLLGSAIVVFGGWLAWNLIVRRGALTWMRLAYKPARLFATGDIGGAETALQHAIARAEQFPPGSQQRGMMLEPIAEFLGNLARSKEARAAFDECIATLEQYAKKNPMDYFVALNNYAVFLLFHKEYDAAQRILERVLDLALAAKKGSDQVVAITNAQLLTIQFVLHINLVCVFIEMQETDAMRYHLDGADAHLEALPGKLGRQFRDHFLALRARCLFEQKNYESAWKQLDLASDQRHLNILRMRGRLHLHEENYAEAESYFEEYEKAQGKTCVPHHPQHIDLRLHRAECLYHLGKPDGAFASLEEARRLVADFSLPRDARWRARLHPWVQRAHQHAKAELAAALAAELAQSETASETAIAVLERFRVAAPSREV